MYCYKTTLVASIFALQVVGCTTIDSSKLASSDLSTRQVSTPSNQLVNQGLQYLRERNYEDAQKVFSAAVKLSPTSSTIHILTGISYHLEYLKGVPDSKALAETAYSVAYSLDKTDPMALIQLGRLHIDSGDYGVAKSDFVRATSVGPQNADALYGLLQAALLSKDMETSIWAGDKLAAMNTGSLEHQKTLTLMYTIIGKQDLASQFFNIYRNNSNVNSGDIARLQSQLDYIKKRMTQSLAAMDQSGFIKTAGTSSVINSEVREESVTNQSSTTSSKAQNLGGQTGSSGAASNSGGGIASKALKVDAAKKVNSNSQNSSADNSSDSSSDTSSSGSGASSLPVSSGVGMANGGMGGLNSGSGAAGGGSGTYNVSVSAPQQKKWFDCDAKPGLGKAPGGGYGVPVGGTSGDQTLYLEPLPAPCQGQTSPKMAMIDAVLIRTVDAASTSNGVNLLQGLQIFAGAQRTTTTGQLPINASVMGLGTATSATLNSVSGLLTYSMNIANAVSTSAQVVAKPTLTALDRIPSTFYSGQVQTVGLNGGGVSGAQVSNVPTGTSLSVTPTFIDEDSMMLAVKVSRSFIETTAPVGGFNAGISTQNHNVTANVKIRFGETLILDGLTDRGYNKSRDGVPVLQDIPIIQYLFSNVVKSQYSEDVVVLITPRRIVSSEADLKKLESEMMTRTGRLNQQELSIYDQIGLYNKLLAGRSNADSALLALNRDSVFFRELKNEVLISNDWIAESETKKFLKSAANMLYFN